MGLAEEYAETDRRNAELLAAVEAGLSDREKDLLYSCFTEKMRAYRRKRSWRLSEVAAAQANVIGLARKLGIEVT